MNTIIKCIILFSSTGPPPQDSEPAAVRQERDVHRQQLHLRRQAEAHLAEGLTHHIDRFLHFSAQ